jgi:hypothetical protein
MGNVYEFRPRRKIACCASCGGRFQQRHPRHQLCPGCYWWNIGLRARELAARAFHELHLGGYR